MIQIPIHKHPRGGIYEYVFILKIPFVIKNFEIIEIQSFLKYRYRRHLSEKLSHFVISKSFHSCFRNLLNCFQVHSFHKHLKTNGHSNRTLITTSYEPFKTRPPKKSINLNYQKNFRFLQNTDMIFYCQCVLNIYATRSIYIRIISKC